jgi:hypothetical protein
MVGKQLAQGRWKNVTTVSADRSRSYSVVSHPTTRPPSK